MKSCSIYKRMTALCLAMLMLVLSALPVFAAPGNSSDSEDNVIRLGFFEFGGMFEGAEENVKKSGYCYEYMMQIAIYTGWKYEFVYGSYAELYDLLKKGKIDILPYTNYNEQRGREVLFSDKEIVQEEYYIAVKPESRVLASGDSKPLNGIVISTIEGADYNNLLLQYIEKNGLDIKIAYYPTLNETWDALREGVVDATVFTSNAYSHDAWVNACSFGNKPTYIAVSKDRSDLLPQLNEAADFIEKDIPEFLGDLYAKYFSDNPMRQSLTAEENAWVAKHPVLHVGCFTNDAPYIFSCDEENHTATGLTVEVIEGIIDRLGLDISADYRCYDTLAQMESALNSGEIDVIVPFYPDFYVAQQHKLIISNMFRTSNMELVYLNDTTYVDAQKRIATPATKLGIYYVNDNFPESEVIGANSIQDAVDRVLSGEATGAIAQNIVLHNIKEKYDNLNYAVLPEGCGTCFAARPENYALIRIINRGLNYFSNAEITAISSKYSLDPTVTTKAYLATHKEAIVFIVIISATLVALLLALIQMKRLKTRADVANQSKTTFLFNMSHDIRTPMNAITGFTDKALRHKDDPKVLEESLDKIKSSSAYLLRIINDILDMAKIESGKLELIPSIICTENKHDALLQMFAAEAMRKGIDLHASYDVKDKYLWVDESRMSQILANLLSNAIKYTDAGGKIWYSCNQIPGAKIGYGKFEIIVEDTGRGMSQEFQKKIFDSFEREESAIKSGAQGTGLGMAIVKRLADAMGAVIDIESEIGKGTKIIFTVEHRIATPEEIAVFQAKQGNRFEDMHDSMAGKRVLVVEDNEMNREIAVDLLEDEGLVVDTAEDGSVAVEMMKSLFERQDYGYYSAILMDVQMPVMNGYDATRAIRKIPVPSGVHIPIIAMTANAFEEDKQNAYAAGMDAHIAKPIDVSDLFETLSRFL